MSESPAERSGPESKEKGTKNFEQALARLEEIVSQLETGELSLEESIRLFEEGTLLSQFCEGRLQEAERKVEMLVKNAKGEMRPVPFTEEGSDGGN